MATINGTQKIRAKSADMHTKQMQKRTHKNGGANNKTEGKSIELGVSLQQPSSAVVLLKKAFVAQVSSPGTSILNIIPSTTNTINTININTQ